MQQDDNKNKEVEAVHTQIDMNIIIHLDIEVSIPCCHRSGKENFCFCRQLMIPFNVLLQDVAHIESLIIPISLQGVLDV